VLQNKKALSKRGINWKAKPGGRRKKGKPRLRWMNDVELDLRNIGVTKWRTRVLDRTKWAPVVRKAKTKLSELQCYRRRNNFLNVESTGRQNQEEGETKENLD